MAEPREAQGIRKIVAQRMLESWQTSPVVVYNGSMDTTKMKAFSKSLSESCGRKISVNVILAKACAKALKEFPAVNGSFVDNMIYEHEDINVGFAVSVKDGVMVPNVKHCDTLPWVTVAEELDRLFEGVKINKVTYDDITGGTFTITNMGVTKAVESHMPIINQPELAILGVYAPRDTPVAIDGEVVIRPMMNLCLVADHRLIDGVLSGEFLGRIKELLENPELI